MKHQLEILNRLGVLRRDNFTCKHCSRQLSRDLLEVDHIVPKALGGSNSIENLQTLCRTCNRRKGARFIG